MPKVARGRRKRAYQPKTRTGCLTCKIRRVKCDETRPDCTRCTSTLRVCGGYAHVESPQSSQSSPNSLAIMTSPSFDTQAPTKSKRSFAFFVQRTCPQLAGFFGSEFWERLVLQAAYHEPAICHAVVAIGSLHEFYEYKRVATDMTEAFALEQYNHAIRDLLIPLSNDGKQAVDVCLISCILFTCFENMQGHHDSAGRHIRSGVKLLLEAVDNQRNGTYQYQKLGNKSVADSYVPLEVLTRVFANLGDQQARQVSI
ncbi:hypothetical protein BKA67DRAFT_673919 [Truncatella angustata]|uniref:Zn(2)-C6 fungal-type domain-containing protein n=1 Tax=Truncatella angustata TaxID=152316 RepID=A0A9P8UU91_9PEZI|nr:uncharacterized protein BKA67DRAFT_673919 [Truncatella angustata]KAH6658110.1 hypothetical protein BKA67DRAFT_673919 [Truncatella angustata]